MNWKTKTDKIRSELSLHQFKFDVREIEKHKDVIFSVIRIGKYILFDSIVVSIWSRRTMKFQWGTLKVPVKIFSTEAIWMYAYQSHSFCIRQLKNVFLQFQPLNERMTISNVTNSTLECSTISESEAKSERILNYMDYAIMESKSKDSQADDTSLCYLDSPSTCRSLPGNKDESELKTETRLNHESYVEPNMQSEKMYKFMSESMSLLQATKSDILKIFEEKQNRLQTEAQNERSSDAAAKILDSVEKKRKQLLTEAICKIRSHVDDLEQVSRLF